VWPVPGLQVNTQRQQVEQKYDCLTDPPIPDHAP